MAKTLILKSLKEEVKKRFGELDEEAMGSQMCGLALVIDSNKNPESKITKEQFNIACQALDLLHSQTAKSYDQAKDILNGAEIQTQAQAQEDSPLVQVLDYQSTEMAADVPRVIAQGRNQWAEGIGAALFTMAEEKLSRMDIQAEVDAIIQEDSQGKNQPSFLTMLGLPQVEKTDNPKQLSGS